MYGSKNSLEKILNETACLACPRTARKLKSAVKSANVERIDAFIRVRGVFQASVRILTLTLREMGNLKGFGQN